MSAVLIAAMRRLNPGLTTVDAQRAVDQVFGAVRDALESGDDVRIAGFGTFRRKLRAERQVRNPRTGERSIMREHHVFTFKAAKSKGGRK